MPEVPPRPEVAGIVAPIFLGAVFREGRYRSLVYDWRTQKDLVPVVDVEYKEQRDKFMLENLRVFADGTIPSPEKHWKEAIDIWLADLKAASASPDIRLPREEVKEAELDLKAMVAVSASARSMEASSGAAAKYVKDITAGTEDLDMQDTLREYLLHDDPEKLNRVLSNSFVKRYYQKILRDAGIEDIKEWRKVGAEWRPSKWKTKVREARRGKLVEYLRSKGIDYKGGFNGYIADVLLADDTDLYKEGMGALGFGDECRWAAARLACDAFLVDKYTRWEFEIDKKGNYRMKPSLGWGGDPFRMILEPSLLPRRIKRMYQKEDEAILNMIDQAFRPEDIFRGSLKKELLSVSASVHLKDYARYSSALWTFLGASSRAAGVPVWTEKTMYEELPGIAELLDQVYGGISKPRANTGKHIVGTMMARILQCKALAVAVESTRPGFGKKMRLLFGTEEEAKPFWKTLQHLWGPDYDASSGLLASFAGGRTRFVFKNNDYGAEKTLLDAYNLLFTTDQDPKGRGKAQLYRTVRSAMVVAQALSKAAGER